MHSTQDRPDTEGRRFLGRNARRHVDRAVIAEVVAHLDYIRDTQGHFDCFGQYLSENSETALIHDAFEHRTYGQIEGIRVIASAAAYFLGADADRCEEVTWSYVYGDRPTMVLKALREYVALLQQQTRRPTPARPAARRSA